MEVVGMLFNALMEVLLKVTVVLSSLNKDMIYDRASSLLFSFNLPSASRSSRALATAAEIAFEVFFLPHGIFFES